MWMKVVSVEATKKLLILGKSVEVEACQQPSVSVFQARTKEKNAPHRRKMDSWHAMEHRQCRKRKAAHQTKRRSVHRPGLGGAHARTVRPRFMIVVKQANLQLLKTGQAWA